VYYNILGLSRENCAITVQAKWTVFAQYSALNILDNIDIYTLFTPFLGVHPFPSSYGRLWMCLWRKVSPPRFVDGNSLFLLNSNHYTVHFVGKYLHSNSGNKIRKISKLNNYIKNMQKGKLAWKK
jgi:hypothetical protein